MRADMSDRVLPDMPFQACLCALSTAGACEQAPTRATVLLESRKAQGDNSREYPAYYDAPQALVFKCIS
ncbi:hypothetical protein WJX72_000088 [[Myrmecia] bisecta]|uniref:Uncharacterized protein n=1 Tax=[Myrmecia] bisecta TaxID=41462 RepID=A0AAW1PJ51_9CHLO